jgi:hypothetical protein
VREEEDDVTDREDLAQLPDIEALGERHHLEQIVRVLSRKPTDPKLEAVLHFLLEKTWLEQEVCWCK